MDYYTDAHFLSWCWWQQ